MAEHVLDLSAPGDLAPTLGDHLRESGTLGIWEVSPAHWRAYFFSEDPDLPRLLESLQPGLRAVWEREERVDWAARYQASLQPIAVGRRFAILPAPELLNPWPSRIALRLVPGMAFGTGEHFTTSSCLAVMEGMVPFPVSVLDVGCGSGILAAAACALGSSRVVACDVDEDACQVARETASVNGVRFQVTRGSADAVPGTFDLVLANILAETLTAILPDLRRRVAGSGLLVGSGILLAKGRAVLEAAEREGFDLLKRRSDGEWWTFLWALGRGPKIRRN